MVTFVDVIKPGHGADAAIVYVTAYVPGVLEDGLIFPVDASIDKPVVELYVPPAVPVNVTVALLLDVHSDG